jgi:hypothetical protein
VLLQKLVILQGNLAELLCQFIPSLLELVLVPGTFGNEACEYFVEGRAGETDGTVQSGDNLLLHQFNNFIPLVLKSL